MDDFRKILYVVIIGFIGVIVSWISFVTFTGCGSFSTNTNCAAAAPKVDRTSIPTLMAATLPAPVRFLAATAAVFPQTPAGTAGGPVRPSNPGGPGAALALTGNADSGKQIFAVNCAICHGQEGKGGNPNPGSTRGTIPTLNPIDPSLKNVDPKIFATNLDLFIEHGSTPAGAGPVFSMPAWGDKQKLQPQQIADVIAYVMSLNK